MKDDLTPRARLIYEALRFANWAAGQGICAVEGEPTESPEDFLFAYSTATGDEDWDTLAERLAAADAVGGAEGWARIDDTRRSMIYSLRCAGHHRGQPVEVNDVAIIVERCPGSQTDIKPIVDAILRALPAAPKPGAP